jgi:hypothetical protein
VHARLRPEGVEPQPAGGKLLISVGKEACVWEPATGKKLATIGAAQKELLVSAVFLPGGDHLAVVSFIEGQGATTTVKFWDLRRLLKAE